MGEGPGHRDFRSGMRVEGLGCVWVEVVEDKKERKGAEGSLARWMEVESEDDDRVGQEGE